ncbi:MAG TPA: IclR family transcriptional regulator [Burkholderiales bacterium]|nr:IclR family transcriptional regulator [Burkholderiales bacterium]
MQKHQPSGVKAVETAGRILEVLARAQEPVALRELATGGRMSPGKVHRYLASFVASGLASQDPGTRRYSLGPLAMRLGLAALSSYQPLREAIQLQRELRDRFDETFVLSVWGGQGPTIVHVEESSQPIIMTMRIGATLPMLATASGLVFAAYLPRHFTEPLLKASVKAGTGLNAIARDSASIKQLIRHIREQGYAHNHGHLMSGVSALAFPLIGPVGKLVAVLAVMGREERINPNDGAQMIAHLKEATRAFSH